VLPVRVEALVPILDEGGLVSLHLGARSLNGMLAEGRLRQLFPRRGHLLLTGHRQTPGVLEELVEVLLQLQACNVILP
jgi:hypothetical protein